VEGEPTEFEKSFKLINTFSRESKDPQYLEDTNLVYPDEQFVMKLADNGALIHLNLVIERTCDPD
jgi:hypothetical protein